jgi:hypothetical protein
VIIIFAAMSHFRCVLAALVLASSWSESDWHLLANLESPAPQLRHGFWYAQVELCEYAAACAGWLVSQLMR